MVWIASAMALCGIAMVAGGFILARRANRAGLDSELMRDNPGMATGKLLAATDPDIEIVSSDDQHGLVTLRQRSTGKTLTMNLDEMKQGRIDFRENSKDRPGWIPVYPHSTRWTAFSAGGKQGQPDNFRFETQDAPGAVLAFYQSTLTQAGFKVDVTPTLISALDSVSHRNLLVSARSDDDRTKVSITYSHR